MTTPSSAAPPPHARHALVAALIAAASGTVPAQDARLAPVIVTGKGFEQRVFDTPYSVNVIEAETLRNGGLMVNLSETMARVPGLTVNNRNNFAQDLQISSRGYGARATFGVRGMRLYSDGIPATMPDGQGQVSHFDLAGAQRVEVLRGPFSALYGNSSGGVIALFSAPVRERSAEVALDVARFGSRQGRISLQAPLSAEPGKGWDIRVGASYFETEGFRPQSEAERTLGNVRLGYTGERDTIVIALNHLDQPALDPLGLTRAQIAENPRQTVDVALPQDALGQANRFNTRKNTEQSQIGLHWRHRFDAGALSESAVTAYAGQRAVTQWQSIPPGNPAATPPGGQFAPTSPGGVIDFDRDYAGVDGRLIWRWQLEGGRNAQFVAGAAYEQSEEDRRGYRNFIGPLATRQLGVTGELRRDEANKVETTDVYAQGEYEFVKDWTGSLGVRSGKLKFRSDDRYIAAGNPDDSGSLEFSYTNPVAALQWRASPALSVYLSAGRGFESPTFNELAYRPGGATGFNSELKAQKSRQIELGAKWRADGLGLGLDAAVFDARTSDEIGVLSNVGGRSTFQNVGDTTRRGAELAMNWEISRALRAAAALTWLQASYDDSPASAPTIRAGNRIAGTSARSAFAEVAWRPAGSDLSELALEARAQARVAVNDANDDPTTAAAGDGFAPGWATLALRARQAWQFGANSRLEALLRLDNLTNRDYVGSVIVNEGNSRFYEPGAPRIWYLGVKWRQGF